MKFSKRIFLSLTFAMLTLLTVQAQRGGGQGNRGASLEERVEKQTEKMVTDLALSAAQGEKIKAVNMDFAKKMMVARNEAREAGDWDAMRATMKTMRAEQKTALKKYLTADQMAKWEKIQAERPQRQRGERKGKKKLKEEKS